MDHYFKTWTTTFPGKMGLSWKDSGFVGTKEEAESEAAKNCNVVAVPLQLFEKMKEHERRMVEAERTLDELRWNLSQTTRNLTTLGSPTRASHLGG